MEITRPQCKDNCSFVQVSAAMCLFLLICCATGYSQTFSVIHSFSGSDGASPKAGLTIDAAGNLYGTTANGGVFAGIVFQLKYRSSAWVLNPLYKFQAGSDGGQPNAKVVFGPDGSLYGTGTYNHGNVFKLQPSVTACKTALCPWIETVLYHFRGGTDGDYPAYGPLVFDAAGTIYGSTINGGSQQCDTCGVVYTLTRSGSNWTENVIHYFLLQGDGQSPEGGVIFDRQGNLYGTTNLGVGSGCIGNGCGTVFEMTPPGSGWTESILYNFAGGSDGAGPIAGLISDTTGNLYGATTGGGANNGGTVFELTPSGGGWSLTVLYQFARGIGPYANLAMDTSGNLYGTTYAGGTHGLGSVFKLSPSNGSWTYRSLHDFSNGSDGGYPISDVVLDSSGNLYGTASSGGTSGFGVVWEVTP